MKKLHRTLTVRYWVVAISIALFILPNCGTSWLRGGSESEHNLTASDWSLDENGHFLRCPVIDGCDNDGDCIMNAHDQVSEAVNDWRQACTEKYSQENALDLCMNEYGDEYKECVGEDFENIMSEASTPTLGEYFKNSPEIIQILAGLSQDYFGELLYLDQEKYFKTNKNIKKGIIDFFARKLKLRTRANSWRNHSSEQATDGGSTDQSTQSSDSTQVPENKKYNKSEHGKNAFAGLYNMTYIRKANGKECKASGTIFFTEKRQEQGEGFGGHAIVKIESSQCAKEGWNAQNISAVSYAIKEDKITLVPHKKDKNGFSPTGALNLQIVIDKVGCYPHGGRTDPRNGTKIEDGHLMTYEDMKALMEKEKLQCLEIYCGTGDDETSCTQDVTCDKKSGENMLGGVAAKVSLEGKENGSNKDAVVAIIAEKQNRKDKQGKTNQQAGPTYCLSSVEANHGAVLVAAKKKKDNCEETAALDDEDDVDDGETASDDTGSKTGEDPCENAEYKDEDKEFETKETVAACRSADGFDGTHRDVGFSKYKSDHCESARQILGAKKIPGSEVKFPVSPTEKATCADGSHLTRSCRHTHEVSGTGGADHFCECADYEMPD